MPHPRGTGTTHHCPGAKLPHYVKLGRCRVIGDCCRTHQVQCPDSRCEGWVHLNEEPCPKCTTRVEEERKKANAPAEQAKQRREQALEERRAEASRTKGKNPLKERKK